MRFMAVAALATLLVGTVGCDRMEDWREGRGERGRLALSLQTPETLDWGDEGTIQVGLENQGGATVPGATVELYLPTWLEFGSVEPAGTEVTLLSGATGTRLSYRMTETLQPGERRTITQRVRVPAAGTRGIETAPTAAPGTPGEDTVPVLRPPPSDRVVRARLVGRDGEVIGGELQAVLAFRGAAPVPLPENADAPSAEVRIERDRVAQVRLGMNAAEVRRIHPTARDTTIVAATGTAQGALIVPVGGDRQVAAVLGERGVERIGVRDPRIATPQGFGVGSRVSELRGAYGRECVDALPGGRTALRFSGAPGLSFVLEPFPQTGTAQAPADTVAVPEGARVAEVWVVETGAEC